MTGAELIAAERRRQQEMLGWTQDHDNRKADDELVHAAICYAMPEGLRKAKFWFPWPWELSSWHPEDRIRDLTKAGALLAAEIDRMQSKQAARAAYEAQRAADILKAAEEQAERVRIAALPPVEPEPVTQVTQVTGVAVIVQPEPTPEPPPAPEAKDKKGKPKKWSW